MLFTSYIFVNFPDYLLFYFQLNSTIAREYILYNFNILKFTETPFVLNILSILENVPYEKNVYFVSVGYSVLKVSVRSGCCMALFKSVVFLLIICLLLSTVKSRLSMSDYHNWTISPFCSVLFSFLYLGSLLSHRQLTVDLFHFLLFYFVLFSANVYLLMRMSLMSGLHGGYFYWLVFLYESYFLFLYKTCNFGLITRHFEYSNMETLQIRWSYGFVASGCSGFSKLMWLVVVAFLN